MKLNKKIFIILILFTTTIAGGISLVELRQNISTVGKEIKILELEVKDLKIDLEVKEKKLAELYRPARLEGIIGGYMRSPQPKDIIVVQEESMIDSDDTIALMRMRRMLGESLR